MPELWEDAGFGVYIHWPYCQAKCPYCDFNSHVAATIDQDRWLSAYLADIDRVAEMTGPRKARSVFFGGGTPSLMEPRLVNAVLDRIEERWPMDPSAEVTLEANPTSVEAALLTEFRAAGVNRVSLGIQALNDTDLRRLGRLHSAAEALSAYGAARETFDRVSFDLIYAREDQTVADWEAELTQALALGPDHVSLYQLTIEDGTAFGERHRRGRMPGLPDEDRAADLFEITQEMTDAAGLPAYEISNHARAGLEAQHNLIYWESGDYAGIGPGAHGRLTLNGTRLATEAPRAPAVWLAATETSSGPAFKTEPVGAEGTLAEFLMMGLRVKSGVSLERAARFTGWDVIREKAGTLEDSGLLSRDEERLRVTDQGRPVLNAVLRELLA